MNAISKVLLTILSVGLFLFGFFSMFIFIVKSYSNHLWAVIYLLCIFVALALLFILYRKPILSAVKSQYVYRIDHYFKKNNKK